MIDVLRAELFRLPAELPLLEYPDLFLLLLGDLLQGQDLTLQGGDHPHGGLDILSPRHGSGTSGNCVVHHSFILP